MTQKDERKKWQKIDIYNQMQKQVKKIDESNSNINIRRTRNMAKCLTHETLSIVIKGTIN